MILKRLFRIVIFLLFVGVISACGNAPSNSENPPSRYDLITVDKISPSEDDHPPLLHSDEWEAPRPIKGYVNSAGLEDSPFITPDGNTLFFFYTPSAATPAGQQITDQVTGIYRSSKVGGVWEEPQRVVLSEGKSPALDGCPFYQNNELWFCSIRSGNFRDIDIWIAEMKNDQWVDIVNAGEYLNKTLGIGEMHIHPNSSILYFHKADDHQNGYELWEVQRKGAGWGAPRSLDNLNSPLDDSRPALSPDGKELWFTRTFNGTPGIFRSLQEDGKRTDPQLILSQFAGEPSIDQYGNIYFTHHFFKNDNMIEADIYIAEKK